MVRIHSGPSPARVLHRPVIHDYSIAGRALDTEYQNTTGRPILVIVSSSHEKNAAGDMCFMTALTLATSPVAGPRAIAGFRDKVGSGTQRGYFTIQIVVPSNWYYEISTSTGGTSTVALTYWIEVTL